MAYKSRDVFLCETRANGMDPDACAALGRATAHVSTRFRYSIARRVITLLTLFERSRGFRDDGRTFAIYFFGARQFGDDVIFEQRVCGAAAHRARRGRGAAATRDDRRCGGLG